MTKNHAQCALLRSSGSTLPPPLTTSPLFPQHLKTRPPNCYRTPHHSSHATFFLGQSVHKQFAKPFIYVDSHVQRTLVARACTPHREKETSWKSYRAPAYLRNDPGTLFSKAQLFSGLAFQGCPFRVQSIRIQ
jgi:hypothetical protein